MGTKKVVGAAERWRRAWEASPEGKATMALYRAAKAVGMEEELRRACTEIVVSTWEGETKAYVVWERELTERPEFVVPVAALERAEAWLKKYAARMGWIAV